MPLLRVWWVPQVPMPAFRQEVETVLEAKLLLHTLALYDRFQYENNVKPDYCSAGGLEEFDPEDEEWIEWFDTVSGEDIGRFTLPQLRQLDIKLPVNG